MTEQPSDELSRELKDLQDLIQQLGGPLEPHTDCDDCSNTNNCKFKEIQTYFRHLDSTILKELSGPCQEAIMDEMPPAAFEKLVAMDPPLAYQSLSSTSLKAGFYYAIKAIREGAITPIEIQP